MLINPKHSACARLDVCKLPGTNTHADIAVERIAKIVARTAGPTHLELYGKLIRNDSGRVVEPLHRLFHVAAGHLRVQVAAAAGRIRLVHNPTSSTPDFEGLVLRQEVTGFKSVRCLVEHDMKFAEVPCTNGELFRIYRYRRQVPRVQLITYDRRIAIVVTWQYHPIHVDHQWTA